MLVEALNDKHPEVLFIALSGLGHTPVPEALPKMLSFVDHPDKWCRKSLAFALCSYENNDPHVTDTLLKLAADEYEITRDWATTALKWSHVDTLKCVSAFGLMPMIQTYMLLMKHYRAWPNVKTRAQLSRRCITFKVARIVVISIYLKLPTYTMTLTC